ncbi:hypothetical protein EG799_12780 [Aurantiacibacter spongiae]|uniref:Uncharacterized protein n=2 Tax=Aurantiacibacter spongiae TaxID=2488860 RepID=A0A3N5DNA2_9SPHN|nr:hypothetical protein EG799_12780 [Aurantiacibacter spongiae]
MTAARGDPDATAPLDMGAGMLAMTLTAIPAAAIIAFAIGFPGLFLAVLIVTELIVVVAGSIALARIGSDPGPARVALAGFGTAAIAPLVLGVFLMDGDAVAAAPAFGVLGAVAALAAMALYIPLRSTGGLGRIAVFCAGVALAAGTAILV